eukprot:CAMPEP_0171833336 /NCGR_PEP_ID=MMETSP0992-20121227/9835_1 /TAXON_ID=483369 /ORGANISM="non described non described, Strain CCMP2098" /LENGTH=379 /DNA_ID=CAMNT_0012448965 /DNA_START=293 /DNA_END=1432 /DNA_ORIENTATION=-
MQESGELDTATKASQVDEFLVSLARDPNLLNVFLTKLPSELKSFLDSADFMAACHQKFDALLADNGGGVPLSSAVPSGLAALSDDGSRSRPLKDGAVELKGDSAEESDCGLSLKSMGTILVSLVEGSFRASLASIDTEEEAPTRGITASQGGAGSGRQWGVIAGTHLTANLCDRFLEIFDQDDNGIIDRKEFFEVNRFFVTLSHLEDYLLGDDDDDDDDDDGGASRGGEGVQKGGTGDEGHRGGENSPNNADYVVEDPFGVVQVVSAQELALLVDEKRSSSHTSHERQLKSTTSMTLKERKELAETTSKERQISAERESRRGGGGQHEESIDRPPATQTTSAAEVRTSSGGDGVEGPREILCISKNIPAAPSHLYGISI